MAKKRKTRSQKISSDLRHPPRQIQNDSNRSPQSSVRIEQPTFTYTSETKSTPATTLQYPFLKHDLLKTLSLTGAIVIAEFVLFFLL